MVYQKAHRHQQEKTDICHKTISANLIGTSCMSNGTKKIGRTIGSLRIIPTSDWTLKCTRFLLVKHMIVLSKITGANGSNLNCLDFIF